MARWVGQVADHAVAVKVFGLTQAALVVAIAGAIYYYRRRQRERDEAALPGLRSVPRRDPARQAPDPVAEKVSSGPANRAATAPSKSGSATAENAATQRLESALPLWDARTPPHEILGVAPGAPAAAVEAAYKAALKRYHPDRVAHWGPGYQKRAHRVVLLLQQARERMLKNA